ncbi:DUF1304 domain-containing protein [Lapillicoccus jejuensis]|uniref:Putative membrane protein n=1 Tax=Lapillicoccus jejuensis TaxID=402171 RepID=A0A542E6A2_9MICO|nr:DUF1304 domain-containing protein [Lapillicoccus jejuensis]TQJ10834.1 putative membrane protein [Lapillicoccus jejuensis]
MQTVALAAATLAGLLHVVIFLLESLLWRRPATWRRFAVADQATADTLAPMAYNQGFYNLFLALGALAGVVGVATGHRRAGWALLFFCCGAMLVAALVLVTSGRRYRRAATTQGLLPLVAVLAAAVTVTTT